MYKKSTLVPAACALLLGIIIGIPAGQRIAEGYQANLQAELDNAESRAGLYYSVNQSLIRQLAAETMATEQARTACRTANAAAAYQTASAANPMAGVVLEPSEQP